MTNINGGNWALNLCDQATPVTNVTIETTQTDTAIFLIGSSTSLFNTGVAAQIVQITGGPVFSKIFDQQIGPYDNGLGFMVVQRMEVWQAASPGTMAPVVVTVEANSTAEIWGFGYGICGVHPCDDSTNPFDDGSPTPLTYSNQPTNPPVFAFPLPFGNANGPRTQYCYAGSFGSQLPTAWVIPATGFTQAAGKVPNNLPNNFQPVFLYFTNQPTGSPIPGFDTFMPVNATLMWTAAIKLKYDGPIPPPIDPAIFGPTNDSLHIIRVNNSIPFATPQTSDGFPPDRNYDRFCCTPNAAGIR